MQRLSILYSKKSGDADILLNKNRIKACLIREQRPHGLDEKAVEINIKLDGRPFWSNSFELTQLLSVLWEQEVHP